MRVRNEETELGRDVDVASRVRAAFRGLADDRRALHLLQCERESFRRGGRGAAGEDVHVLRREPRSGNEWQRAVLRDRSLRAAFGIRQRRHAIEEIRREKDDHVAGATAVATEVDDHGIARGQKIHRTGCNRSRNIGRRKREQLEIADVARQTPHFVEVVIAAAQRLDPPVRILRRCARRCLRTLHDQLEVSIVADAAQLVRDRERELFRIIDVESRGLRFEMLRAPLGDVLVNVALDQHLADATQHRLAIGGKRRQRDDGNQQRDEGAGHAPKIAPPARSRIERV